LIRTVDPDFEWPVLGFLFNVTNEQGKLAEGTIDHVGPGQIAFWQIRAVWPTQGGEHGCRQILDVQTTVGIARDKVLWLLLLFFLLWCVDRQDGAQYAVRAVGGQTLQARFPGLHVQILEVFVRVVGRDVDGFRDRGIDVGGNGGHHVLMCFGRHFQRGNKVIGQVVHITAEVAVQTPCVIFNGIFFDSAVGHALLAGVGPREGGFDTVRGVVGKGQGDGAGRRDRQQVRVTQTMFADLGLDLVGQARGKVAARQVQLGVEQRESAAFLGQFDRGQICGVTHVLGDFGGHGQRFLRVVTQLEHVQGIAQARETEADTALVHGFLLLVGERPVGGIEHVVQHAGRDLDDFAEGSEIESSLFSEWVADKMRQIDRAQAAAAIGRQRLFGTRVGGFDQFAIVQVVVLVHAIQEQDARFGVVVGGLHDLIPQITGTHLAVDPQAVFALVGTFGQDVFVRFCNVNQFNGIVRFNRFHERISHADRDVEVGQVALVFGMDEQLDIRMIATHDTHLGTTACTG